MKLVEKEAARKLRKEQGYSVTQICKALKVSKSSVSYWVRDIELTEEQKYALYLRNPVYHRQNAGAETNKREALKKRSEYQEQGRVKALEKNFLHTQGCMLYWAEGSKTRNSVGFTNSDAGMLRFFLRFLRECYSVKDDEIKISINCYTNNGLTVEEIENHWINMFGLSRENLTKTIHDNRQHRNTGQKKGKHPYGICRITVSKTDLLQSIYGAIQEYSKEEYPNWLR